MESWVRPTDVQSRGSIPVQSLFFGICQGRRRQRMSGRDPIVLVFDLQLSVSTQPHFGNTVIAGREPEILHFHVVVLNDGVFGPEGRILCRLRLDVHDGKIFSIDPDLAAIQELAWLPRFHTEHIHGTFWSRTFY